jgi:hypothetical protein
MTSSEAASGFPSEGPVEEQRAWALKQARQVIAVSASPFGGTREISAVDLVSLSDYILTGEDPWTVTATRESEPKKTTSITTTEVTVEVTRASDCQQTLA